MLALKKTTKKIKNFFSSFLRETRLELAQLAPLAPQASVSTDSTTPAECL